jgi:hypothetical protein
VAQFKKMNLEIVKRQDGVAFVDGMQLYRILNRYRTNKMTYQEFVEYLEEYYLEYHEFHYLEGMFYPDGSRKLVVLVILAKVLCMKSKSPSLKKMANYFRQIDQQMKYRATEANSSIPKESKSKKSN